MKFDNLEFDDKVKTSQNDYTYDDIGNIFFDLCGFAFLVYSMSDHKQPIIDQKDDSGRKSDIYCPLKIWINVIPKPIQGIRYLILTSISTLQRSSWIKSGLLDFIIFISFANDIIQYLDGITSIFSSTRSGKYAHRKHIESQK